MSVHDEQHAKRIEAACTAATTMHTPGLAHRDTGQLLLSAVVSLTTVKKTTWVGIESSLHCFKLSHSCSATLVTPVRHVH